MVDRKGLVAELKNQGYHTVADFVTNHYHPRNTNATLYDIERHILTSLPEAAKIIKKWRLHSNEPI